MNWKTKHYLVPTFRVGHNPPTIIETTATQETYVGAPGHTYTFSSTLLGTGRLKATDKACPELVEG